MIHNEDGTIKPVVVTREGVPQIKSLNPFQNVKAATINKQEGIAVEPCSEGGTMVTSINNGNWIRIAGVDFESGASLFEARIASGSEGGEIEIRTGAKDGRLIGTCSVANTGGWDEWTTVKTALEELEGVHDLYLVFKGQEQDDAGSFNFNWWRFQP